MKQNRWGTVVVAVAFGLGADVSATAQRSSPSPRLLTVGWTGSRGYLGVNFRDVSEEQVNVLQLKEARGAEVTQVDHDGPACKIGIREHDVILQLNGQAVEGAEQLRRMLHEIPAGRTVMVVFSRDGQQQIVNTQLANREALERQAWEQHIPVQNPAQNPAQNPGQNPGQNPSQNAFGSAMPNPRSDRSQDVRSSGRMGFFAAGAPSGAASVPRSTDRKALGSAMLGPAYTGAALELLGPQLAEFFGAPDSNGLLVRSIEANSPAAVAGLKAGDVVLRVNQVAILAAADWMRLMHESKGRPVAVTVLREKRETTLTLTPDAKRRSALDVPAPATPELLSFFASRPVTR